MRGAVELSQRRAVCIDQAQARGRVDAADVVVTREIEYVVLQRVPHAGLPARSSTDLRGF